MEGGDSKALVLSKSVLPSTGYDLSCVCDNNTGLCSCTIGKKDVSSPSTDNTLNKASGATGVVKTIGETSSLVESTLVSRPANEYASSPCAPSYFKSKSSTRNGTDIVLKSFSENDVSNHSPVEDKVKPILKNIEENEKHLIEAHQNVPGEAAKQSFVQETNLDNNRDGTISKALVEPSPPKYARATPRVEEPDSSGVKITNPFPSPVPPVDKSAVHPPIGPVDDNRMGNKKHTHWVKKERNVEDKQGLLAKLSQGRRAKYPNKTSKAVKRKERPKRKVTLKWSQCSKGTPRRNSG